MLDVKVLDENGEEIPILESVDEEEDYVARKIVADDGDDSPVMDLSGQISNEDDIINRITEDEDDEMEDMLHDSDYEDPMEEADDSEEISVEDLLEEVAKEVFRTDDAEEK